MPKKSFNLASNNPALQYLTPVESPSPEVKGGRSKEAKKQEPARQEVVTKVPVGYKPAYIETKSRRLQLLIQPSLYEKLKSYAQNNGLSVNEAAHSLLQRQLEN